eukprot:CAMPEP_0178470156 /NCGR_PEP_ID=MMETSP0696-20121128/380_1 /TAXON_ID=265572 /ORGANISM="Extubocellulus spinifer, Strain CCMP396" /LENGTH=164 /DNA_ID=CAMNT_0020097247 /DNA_START=372 /DNA_END=866 /DNA_ORIENTATION=+
MGGADDAVGDAAGHMSPPSSLALEFVLNAPVPVPATTPTITAAVTARSAASIHPKRERLIPQILSLSVGCLTGVTSASIGSSFSLKVYAFAVKAIAFGSSSLPPLWTATPRLVVDTYRDRCVVPYSPAPGPGTATAPGEAPDEADALGLLVVRASVGTASSSIQ